MAKKDDPGAAAAATDQGKPGKGGKKRLLLIVAAVVVLGAIGAGVFLSGILGGGEETASGEGEHAAAEEKPAASPATIFHQMPDLVISLRGSDRRTTFLKLRLTAEVGSNADIARIEAMMPRVVDYCQLYLRELRPDDLQGSAGTLRLKEELMRRINAAVAPTEVRDILLSELLIQ